ncbi:MAG: integrase [Sphingomonas sp. SCN 67-18]|nr:MAG: integrase [Sphingomonas sp. SCN 67-18]
MHVRGRIHVRQLPSLTKPGVYADGGGLYLRVRPSLTRSWIFICMIKGRRREMGLGSILDVSLAQARDKASVARAAFLEGRDPIAERAASTQPEAAPVTFGEFADALIDTIEGGFRNEKHRKQWRSTLKTHAASLIDKAITDIDTDDVVDVLRPIWLDLPETASRVRGRIERVLDAAKAKGHRQGENPARWRGHLDLLLPRRSKVVKSHHAALPFTGIVDFMNDLRKRPALAARALEFTILTAARSGETLGATWAEIDLEAALWTVPAERMKAGAEHQVPLSGEAVAILRVLRPKKPKPGELVFQRPIGGKLSNMSMAMLLRRMDRTSITVHGFRSTFRDWAGETTQFAREDVEMALAHVIESKSERAYRRGRALDKRRELMTAWANFCFQTGAQQASG